MSDEYFNNCLPRGFYMGDCDKTFCVGGLLGALVGFLIGLLFWSALASGVLDELKNQLQYDKSGLVKVTILERNVGPDKKTWYLLQVSDGQRGYIECHRGNVGDSFLISKTDIKGYHPLRKPGENTEAVSPIVLDSK